MLEDGLLIMGHQVALFACTIIILLVPCDCYYHVCRLCVCTCRRSGGAESSGDIPMEECVAYGTHEKRRGRGDFTVATSECPAYGVVEREERMARNEAYENLKHKTHSHK